jgi:hypothetical protein
MAWTTPATFTVGEVVTASKLNTHIRDNLRYLKGLDGTVTIESRLTVNHYLDSKDPSNTRYRTSLSTVGGQSNVSCYDDTGAVYIPMLIDGSYVAIRPSAAESARFTADGRLGVGTSSPQDILHTVKSPGGFLVFCRTGIGGSAVQITTGASRRIVLWGVAHRVSGGVSQAVNASSAISGSTADIYTDGGANILRVTNTAGTVTVARAAGSDTFDVVLFCAYQ